MIKLKSLLIENVTVENYISGLKDLHKAITEGKGVFSSSDITKMYYQKALKMGVENKFINNSLRLALNKHNKQLTRFDKTEKEIYLEGIELVLKHISK